ncbi:MAG: spore coat protein CotJB [Ruminococcaceae bacterium]|nr:spore coat protein CotJB [Oscillospiraceae bacterium]
MNRSYNNSPAARNGCSHNDSVLLRKIQEIDFSLYEVVLYLDAYPNCAEALNYYHSLLDTRAVLVSEYEHKHGPLTAFSNVSKSSWDWTKTPWPWQL